MRDSMLISSMLGNSAVWYNLSQSDISHLESVDLYLLKKILKCHSKVSKELVHLETGTFSVKHILKRRRLSYLHHLLTRNKNELISKVYYAQKRQPVKGDWVTTALSDMKEIDSDLTEDKIMEMNKKTFKDFLKKKIFELAFSELLKVKQSHSKGKEIVYDKLQMQSYLKSNDIKLEDKLLLFSLRSRTTESKDNFRTMYGDASCNLCSSNIPQSDRHLLDCVKILENCPSLYNNINTEHKDIFGDVERQKEAAALYREVFATKQLLEENFGTS